jgi:hypothetical protein
MMSHRPDADLVRWEDEDLSLAELRALHARSDVDSVAAVCTASSAISSDEMARRRSILRRPGRDALLGDDRFAPD